MTEELQKIDEMFEAMYLKANNKYFTYTNSDWVNDTIAIWDYVKEKLGKPKTQRFVEVEE